jgi:hypothetical protein
MDDGVEKGAPTFQTTSGKRDSGKTPISPAKRMARRFTSIVLRWDQQHILQTGSRDSRLHAISVDHD